MHMRLARKSQLQELYMTQILYIFVYYSNYIAYSSFFLNPDMVFFHFFFTINTLIRREICTPALKHFHPRIISSRPVDTQGPMYSRPILGANSGKYSRTFPFLPDFITTMY